MNAKHWFLVATACLLGTLYLYFFTDWVVPKRIQIIVQNRPGLRMGRRAISPVAFVLDGKYRLTRIEVVPLNPARGRDPSPASWELDSKSNSLPIQGFLYGQAVRGMKGPPALRRAAPLAPGAEYRLLVQAGRTKGQVDFRTPSQDVN